MTTFFMSTWWGDSKNMKEIEFSWWLFELPAKIHSPFSPSGSKFLSCLGLPSKSHREISIFFHIFGIPSSSRHEKCCQMLLKMAFFLHNHGEFELSSVTKHILKTNSWIWDTSVLGKHCKKLWKTIKKERALLLHWYISLDVCWMFLVPLVLYQTFWVY